MEWFGPEREKELLDAIEKGVNRAGMKLAANIKRSMGKSAGGPRSGHAVSAPGSPPNVETGTLRRSIDSTRPMRFAGTVFTRVGTNTEYGPFLEYGTQKMAARPFMRPGLERFRPELVAILGEIRI